MRQSAKFALLSVTALALTGCAQLGAVGNFAWNATENTANFFYKPVASLLRGSPEQAYVFDDSQAYDVVIYPEPVEVETLAERPSEPQIKAPATYQQTAEAPTLQIAQRSEAGFYPTESLPAIPDISFAKIGGGSNMADWLACEMKAGGYLYWEDGKGYVLDPTFENCMRGKDYALESEIALRSSAL